MTTTLPDRKDCIGASEMADVMSDRAADVWVRKVYDIDEPLLDENDPRAIGSTLERAVLDWYSTSNGEELTAFQARGPVPDTPIVSTFDSCTARTNRPVEAKTAGILWSGNLQEWGDQGTADIPERYVIQTHCQMMSAEADSAIVAALLGGRGFVWYEIQRDDELCDAIKLIACQFWDTYVKPGIRPGAEWNGCLAPRLDLLKRIRRVPEKVIEFDDAGLFQVEAWQSFRELRLIDAKSEEQAQAEVIARMGDAESAVLPDGRTLTYFETVRNVKAKDAYTTRYRSLRVK